MILTAHQPAYLPWLGLFHKISLADRFISYDQVQHSHYDWSGRNQILTSSGPLMLVVPCLKKGRFEQIIAEVEINNALPWRRKHWNAIQRNYAKARYFSRYADFFELTYSREWTLLNDLNTYMLRWFLSELGIKVTVESAAGHDFQGQKSDLALDMCRKLGADVFIFGALGREYADTASFTAANIKVAFQDYVHPVYPQRLPGFTPNLSVIDLMFNCGPDSLEILMSGNISRKELLDAA
jgi:hypothetical protein